MPDIAYPSALVLLAAGGAATLWQAATLPAADLAGQQLVWLQGALGAALLAAVGRPAWRLGAVAVGTVAKASLLIACATAGQWGAALLEAALLAPVLVAGAVLLARDRRERAWNRGGILTVEP